MRVIARFHHLMSTTVAIARRASLNAYGEAGYGADIVYKAHLAGDRKLVLNQMGQEVVSAQQVYVGSADVILPTDRITLSTEDVGSTEDAVRRPPILAVKRRSDEYGPHHSVVYLG